MDEYLGYLIPMDGDQVMKFTEYVAAQDKRFDRVTIADERILCFDPGHTTGWAFFKWCNLYNSGQIDTSDMSIAVENLTALFAQYKPTLIVFEDYRIYQNRAKHHAGSEVLTIHVIGCIETLSVQNFLPSVKRMAVIAKKFCTDSKLKEWNFYIPGQKHARDAIRHGAYHILFYHTDRGTNPHHTKKKTKITVG